MPAFLVRQQVIRNTKILDNGWSAQYALEADGQGLFFQDRAIQVWTEGAAHLDMLESEGACSPVERFNADLALMEACARIEAEAEAGIARAMARKNQTGGNATKSGGLREEMRSNATSAAPEPEQSGEWDDAANDVIE